MQSYRTGFVFSHVLGHVTHQKNLQRHVEADPSIAARWILIPSRNGGLLDHLPLVKSHMPLRMSLRARNAIRAHLRQEPFDVLFYHTQITAMLGFRLASRIPTIVSLDATPIDFAQLGAYHKASQTREADRSGLKFRWNQKVFATAAALVTCSAWCKRSLVKDYGVAESRVAVIPPGVELSQWQPVQKAPPEGRKTRLLFVGGDFGRKGGHSLLKAFTDSLTDSCELDIVSNDAPEGSGSIRVHRGLKPNTPELRKLYADADLFVFPSRGDCSPVATIEAMASGLPIVTTDVGALSEQVEDGHNGLVVPPDDAAALASAIKSLASDASRRQAMGLAGRERAEKWFDGGKNYRAALALIKRCADAKQAGETVPDPAAMGLAIPSPK